MAEQEKSKKRLVSEFQRRKNSYLSAYKRLKRLIENSAGQKVFDDITKDRFRVAALDSNKAHKEFREFLLPFFSDTAIKDVFPEEAFAEENDNLKATIHELQRNKQVLDTLAEELTEKCNKQAEKLNETERLQETVSKLEEQLRECKNENGELRRVSEVSDSQHKRTRKNSDKTEQQEMLMRDLEHRLSFRQRGQQNGSRRDRYMQQSLEKIYRIKEDLENISTLIGENDINNATRFRGLVLENLAKLENIASNGHFVIRSERTVVVRKAQTLLDLLNSKCT